MARNKEGRPEWFKFWRRNRQQLDSDLLSMESRGRIFTNMMRYFDEGETADLVEMSQLESYAFNGLKTNIDDAFIDWKETSEKATANINKRWHPDKDNTAEYGGIPLYTDDTEDRSKKKEGRGQKTEDRGQKSEDRERAGKPPRPRFTPPTVEEVSDYCQERQNSINPQAFVDYYTANGWKIGNSTMTDWKAAVRNWENKEQQRNERKTLTFMDLPDKATNNVFLQIYEEDKVQLLFKDWCAALDAHDMTTASEYSAELSRMGYVADPFTRELRKRDSS